MEIILAVLSDGANLTQDGKLNIFGIFQRLYASVVPAVHHTMTLAIMIRTNPSTEPLPHEANFIIKDPDGLELLNSSLAFTPNKTDSHGGVHTLLATFESFSLPKYGDYAISIHLENEFKTIPFTVSPSR